MKLSVLDVVGAVEQTVVLAPRCDELGYERYWIAEHPPQAAPTLMVAIVAGLTTRMRVGTGGILLSHYPPLRTAHDFHFLARVYDGRIDAGFCGAVDTRMPTEELEGRSIADLLAGYDERVGRFVRATRDPALSASGAPPPLWSLGGGVRSADLAARHGIGFGYSLLLTNSVDDSAVVQRYRERFQPSPDGSGPRAVVAVAGICADTRGEAELLAAEWRGRNRFFEPRIVGAPRECILELEAIAERYGADEVVFAAVSADLTRRARCYELLAAP